MASYGKLSEFYPEVESITAYLKQMELFFTANNIADNKEVVVFLSMGRGKLSSLLRDLLAPKVAPVLFQKLKEHYNQSQPLSHCR